MASHEISTAEALWNRAKVSALICVAMGLVGAYYLTDRVTHPVYSGGYYRASLQEVITTTQGPDTLFTDDGGVSWRIKRGDLDVQPVLGKVYKSEGGDHLEIYFESGVCVPEKMIIDKKEPRARVQEIDSWCGVLIRLRSAGLRAGRQVWAEFGRFVRKEVEYANQQAP